MQSLLLPAPCRHCSGPTWMADDEGAVHPCCELESQRVVEWAGCRACRESETLNKEWRRRHGRN